MSYAEGAFFKDETVPQTVSSIVNATSGICKRTLFSFYSTNGKDYKMDR
jgi:hypothetical protein